MNVNLEKLLEDLKQARFWGSIEIQLQDGVPTIFRKSETVKLSQGKTYERSNPKS
jgi:hypothetical protein